MYDAFFAGVSYMSDGHKLIVERTASVCEQANACVCASCEDPRLRWVECTIKHPFKMVHFVTSQDLDWDNKWVGHQVLQAA